MSSCMTNSKASIMGTIAKYVRNGHMQELGIFVFFFSIRQLAIINMAVVVDFFFFKYNL